MDAQTAEVQAIRMIAGCNPMCGSGVVKNFREDPRGGFGFIDVEGSTNIIFHGSRGVVPFFSGDDNPGLFPWNPRVHVFPQTGMHILYSAESGPKGQRAMSWMLWNPQEWQSIYDLIESRPLFRLMRRKGPRIISTKFAKPDGWGTRILWQGKNVLLAPKTRLVDLDDEGVYWEQFEATQQWVKTDFDPRYRMLEVECNS